MQYSALDEISPSEECNSLKKCFNLSVLVGDASTCPTSLNQKYQYLWIKIRETDYEFSLCGIGIFTCHCSDYIASRVSTFEPTEEEFDFTTLKDSSVTTISRTIDFTLPTRTGGCRNACTFSMSATVDESVAEYIEASFVLNAAESYTVTVLVDNDCPEGSYALSLNTIGSRDDDEDSIIYTDTVLL